MNKRNAKVSAIVPCWNEATRIAKVLDVLVDCKALDEILIVDDGSTDGTEKVVQKYLSNRAKYIKHEKNMGKSDAVVTGIHASRGELIVLIDADLIGLTEKDVNALIDPLKNDQYEMIILDRRSDRQSAIGWTGLTRLYGGERSFWKEHFMSMPINKGDGYIIESKLNLHFIKNKWRVRTIYCKNLFAERQFKKHGFVVGGLRYLHMFSSIVGFAGISGLYRMTTKIEEDRLGKLYSLNNRVHMLGPLIILVGAVLTIYTYLESKSA